MSETVINLSPSMSASEIQAEIDAVERWMQGNPFPQITFQFADGTYGLDKTLDFSGFQGHGYINIQGNTGENVNSKHTNQAVFLDGSSHKGDVIYIADCYCLMNIANLKIKAQVGSGCTGRALCTRTVDTIVTTGNYLLGTSNAQGAILSAWETRMKVLNTVFGLSCYGIYCAFGRMYADNNGDGGAGNQPRWGMLCQYTGTIGKAGSQPQGSVANEAIYRGGVIRS